jgi:MFS transporter, DHA1 family, inner membrane transport protein
MSSMEHETVAIAEYPDGREAEPVAAFTAEERRLVGLLAACSFLAFVNFAALAPFLPVVARDLDTSVPLVGQVTTALTLISAGLGLAIGPFADLRGHRRLIVVGIAAVALNLAGMALAPTYAVLLPLAILAAVGDAILFGLPFAVVGERLRGDRQRRAVAWISGGLSLGIVAAPTLLALIGNVVGWRGALLVAAALTLLTVVPALRWLPPDGGHGGAQLTPRSLLAAYRPLAGSRSMLLLYGASGLRSAGVIGAFSYFGAFIADRYQAGAGLVGLSYLAVGLGVLTGDVFSATTTVRAPLRLVTAVAGATSCLLQGAAFALLLPLPVTIALSAGAAGLSSVSYITMTTLMTRQTPGGAGTTMVLNGSVINLGTAVGAAAGGLLIALGGYSLLGLLVPVFVLGGSVLVLLVRPGDPADEDGCGVGLLPE